jgi:hypothetical protein
VILWEVIHHLPYSPSLKPSDVQLFGVLKKHLADKRFAIDADVKQAVTYWLQRLDNDLLFARIHSFVP